ncbi:MAG: hypothetical protein GF329_17940 [Candidatus Lokiarchaeota archaeon]|nr:hypothetical protein [Candidatus Lokiarchaeota archaeon]
MEWTNNSAINYTIDTSITGTFNYTIQFNNSIGIWGNTDSVIVTVIAEPITPIPGFQGLIALIGLITITILLRRKQRYLT